MKNKWNRIFAGVLALCVIAALTGCGAAQTGSKDTAGASVSGADKNGKITVAVSIVPQETFVKAVCGDLVNVITLVPTGYSPENYEPTVAEMEQFADSSVYFSIGVPTEEANILPNVGNVPVVSLQDAVEKVYAVRFFEGGSRDPHIWLSPMRVKVIIETIKDEMIKLDPDNASVYTENAAAYCEQLDLLDAQISSVLTDMENKSFIVFHPAFGYLADDYGLTMYALEEEGSEATAAHLEDMIDFAKQNGIKVIFYQAEIDSSQSEAFAEEIGGETAQLAPLSADYINNLKTMVETIEKAMK